VQKAGIILNLEIMSTQSKTTLKTTGKTHSRVHIPRVDDIEMFARVRQVPLVEIAKLETKPTLLNSNGSGPIWNDARAILWYLAENRFCQLREQG
jgi:hypothetical protein